MTMINKETVVLDFTSAFQFTLADIEVIMPYDKFLTLTKQEQVSILENSKSFNDAMYDCLDITIADTEIIEQMLVDVLKTLKSKYPGYKYFYASISDGFVYTIEELIEFTDDFINAESDAIEALQTKISCRLEVCSPDMIAIFTNNESVVIEI